MNLNNSDFKFFEEKGFLTIKKFFNEADLEQFESCIVGLYAMQAKKIGEYKDRLEKVLNIKTTNFERICAIYEMMENDDKEALYQVQKFFPASPILNDIFNDQFRKIIKEFFGGDESSILISGPGLFINRPNTERLLYKWHSEAHYYPKRRRFINIWFPLFDAKNKSNGTMSFKIKSHKKDFPFVDYQGFNKDTQNKSNFFIQYEIPQNFVDEYDEHLCNTERGDLVIFNRSLVHRSNNNVSPNYSFAGIARVWDPTDDLTLSGDLEAQPYGKNIGRPNLIVEA